MKELKGLKDLYTEFKEALNKNQEFLDPGNDKADHPKTFGKFTYTLSFKEWYLRGDTTKAAMQNFCDLFEAKEKVSNLLDPEILTVSGTKLRMPGDVKAEGLYFTKK
ncbi:MAG: hypothetical protein KC478_16685 [Bacteriovoracaceae bacterium]|nr:hypothetical protein [Bacteriovoracaceae bacterium]